MKILTKRSLKIWTTKLLKLKISKQGNDLRSRKGANKSSCKIYKINMERTHT